MINVMVFVSENILFKFLLKDKLLFINATTIILGLHIDRSHL